MLFFMLVDGATPTYNTQCKIDESLIVKIGHDDMQALEELFTITQRTIHTYVFSILKNPEDAADIVQEVYLKIRASAHLYQPQGKPLAWMFTIAKHLSLSHLRVRKNDSLDDVLAQRDVAAFSYVEDETDRFVLEAALNILKADERQIVLLHVVAGLKHREIAKSFSLPISTVLSKYNRSMKKLKAHLVSQEVYL